MQMVYWLKELLHRLVSSKPEQRRGERPPRVARGAVSSGGRAVRCQLTGRETAMLSPVASAAAAAPQSQQRCNRIQSIALAAGPGPPGAVKRPSRFPQ